MNMRTKQVEHIGPVLEEKGEYQVIDCEACGFAHLLPIPDSGTVEHMYREAYYSTMLPDYIERHTQDQAWWQLVHGLRLDTMASLLPQNTKRILDIGSGPGIFLLTARNKDWDGTGYEPSRQAWEYSTQTLGLTVQNDFFTEHTPVEAGTFDAVHMSDVLEHIADPHSLISGIKKVLRPGGVFCVVVPNDFNPIQKVLRSEKNFEPWWVSPPDHINYFSFDSLQGLLERHGFTVQVQEASFPIDFLLLMGQNYINNDTLGRNCHRWRIKMEETFSEFGLEAALIDVYRALAKHRIGRHAVIYATAPETPEHRG
ncbi:class I SAM-dependent methyltransferase [Oleidesulfovibrio sp.]|uniref:class I SAM-dependent methyltransferase n=1 Tax=Oleidesulfovibrio sp. TaxID=2909707 RepID=UPI003A83FBBC